MSSIRIQTPGAGKVVGTAIDPTTDTSGAKTKKSRGLNLFDLTSLPTGTTVTAKDGSTLTLPGMSQEDTANMQSLFGDVSEDQQDSINDAGEQLGSALFNMLKGSGSQAAKIDISGDDDDDDSGSIKPMTIDTSMFQGSDTLLKAKNAVSGDSEAGSKSAGVSKLATTSTSGSSSPYVGVNEAAPSTAGGTQAVNAATQNASQAYSAANPNASYDNQVQAVTYMGVTNLQDQMTQYAQGVAQKQKAQSAISTDASELRSAVADWPDGTNTQSFEIHSTDSAGNITSTTQDLTKDQASAMADSQENVATSMQDQSQTDMLRLQNMSQNYNNAISTISNLMKVSYDTVKNTVGNIHY